MKIADRRSFAIWALVAVLGVLAIQTVFQLGGIVMMGGLFTVTGDWTVAYDSGTMLLAAVYLLALFVSGLAFIRWQRQMCRGLLLLDDTALDPGLGLSTWGWFIPVVNLVVPYLSMKQVARRLAPEGQTPVTKLVQLWWFTCIVSNVGAAVANGLYALADSPKPWIRATAFEVIVTMPLLLAGMLALQMLRRFSVQLESRLAQRQAVVLEAENG